MANLPFVENDEPIEDLIRNLLRFPGIDRVVDNILGEVPVGDIFHRDMHHAQALVPAQELDKEIAMLVLSGHPTSTSNGIHTSCSSINASISCVLS